MDIRLTFTMNTDTGTEFKTEVIKDLVDDFEERAYQKLGLRLKSAVLDQVIDVAR